MRQSVELQLDDHANGQEDRLHQGHNYGVRIERKGAQLVVDVKGYDNDQCFCKTLRNARSRGSGFRTVPARRLASIEHPQ